MYILKTHSLTIRYVYYRHFIELMHSVNPVVCDQVNQAFMSKQTTAVRQASKSLSFPGTNQAHKYLHISTYIHTAIQYTYVHANIFLKIFNLCDHVSASRWSCAPSHLWTHRVTTSFAAKVLQLFRSRLHYSLVLWLLSFCVEFEKPCFWLMSRQTLIYLCMYVYVNM